MLPAQSFLARVPDSFLVCTNEHSLPKFCELKEQFSSGSAAGDSLDSRRRVWSGHFVQNFSHEVQVRNAGA